MAICVIHHECLEKTQRFHKSLVGLESEDLLAHVYFFVEFIKKRIFAILEMVFEPRISILRRLICKGWHQDNVAHAVYDTFSEFLTMF